MGHRHIVPRYLFGIGTEIGAFQTPIPGIRPIYVDRFDRYAGSPTKAEFYGDAMDLPFLDDSLDYVASSHVLEHVADPVGALLEWTRVLKDQGIIYLVVPHRALTFDRTRPLTPIAHMLEDHANGTTPVDGTHIDEFVDGVDWHLFSPDTPPHLVPETRERFRREYHEAIAAGREINIHFHTFEPRQLRDLISAVNALNGPASIDVLEVATPFPRERPDGFLLVARVHKPGVPVSRRPRWWTRTSDRSSVLKPDARRC